MKKVPNITRAGVSSDYLKALGTVDNCVRRVINNEGHRLVKLATRAFLGRRIIPYREYFNEEEYEAVVHEKNGEAVAKLDVITEKLNHMRGEGVVNQEILAQLLSEARDVIHRD